LSAIQLLSVLMCGKGSENIGNLPGRAQFFIEMITEWL